MIAAFSATGPYRGHLSTRSSEDRINLAAPAMAPAGVLCCGNLVLDILVRPVTELAWGTTKWVDAIEQSIGGNGANTSYTLAKLGNPVRLMGTIGWDESGDRILGILGAAGVDVTHVARSDLPTPLTIALVSANGERALLHRPGATQDAFASGIEFTRELMEGCDRFHLANIFALPRLRRQAADVLRNARQNGLKTSLDTGWDSQGRWMETLRPCLPHVDLLFANQEEAFLLTGSRAAEQAARVFREEGAQEIVIKSGGRGCAVFTCSSSFVEPAFPVSVSDTTGAGDCFVGGFLAALQRGCDYHQSAIVANAAGALSVQSAGSVAGLLSFPDTLAWIKQHMR